VLTAGGGLLSGKRRTSDLATIDDAGVAATRKGVITSTGLLNEASLRIAEEVKAEARETGPSAAQVARLDAASRPAPIFSQCFVERPLVQQLVFGGAAVERRGR
jgi:hypothetical protein